MGEKAGKGELSTSRGGMPARDGARARSGDGMKCNPLRWLLGLIPILLFASVVALVERERVEKDLSGRV